SPPWTCMGCPAILHACNSKGRSQVEQVFGSRRAFSEVRHGVCGVGADPFMSGAEDERGYAANTDKSDPARLRAEQELIEAKEALERKNEELRLQREWFEVTLASIGDAVITTDTRGRITFMNRVAESMTGWAKDEAQGREIEAVLSLRDERGDA